MARRREVFLQGKFLTFDRSNSFQLSKGSNNNNNKPKNYRAGKLATSELIRSGSSRPAYSMSDSDSTLDLESEGTDEEGTNLDPKVEEQIIDKKSRLLPTMHRSVSLGITPKVRGTDHQSVARKRLSLDMSGRMVKTFINTAIDPHILKINPDGTIMVSDETLAGAEFGPLAHSMTSCKDFVFGESQVLSIVLKYATQRIKKLLAPSKRKRRYQEPKTLLGKAIKGATGVSVAKPGVAIEKPVGSTALMGYTAKPIQKKTLAVETSLVSPAVKIGKSTNKKWYQLK